MPFDSRMKTLFLGWLGVFWSVAAWGASITFAGDLATIPPAALALSALLSFIGGAAYSAQKMADPATVVKSVGLEIFKDTLLSFLAGLITFFVVAWAGVHPLMQAAAITISGYGGSRVLEAYLDKFFNWIKEKGPA